MKTSILVIVFLIVSLNSFAQVNELDKFRTELTFFIKYNTGKADTIPKTVSNTLQYKKNAEDVFKKFILKEESKNLDDLKKNSINNETDYIINNKNYYFAALPRDYTVKSPENNVNYQISFYGLYDYDLPNFVSFYIQPFTVSGKDYVVYYYKMNGEGDYYIKDISTNQLVYEGKAFTSNAAILKFIKIDAGHILLVEDMGDNGQRALVIKTEKKPWESINAFCGNAFAQNTVDYTQKVFIADRTYLLFASNRTINSLYDASYLKKHAINFDQESNTISYQQFIRNSQETGKTIEAKWSKNQLLIDDYYSGEHLDSQPMPRD